MTMNLRYAPFILFCALAAALAFSLMNIKAAPDTSSRDVATLPALSLPSLDGKTQWDAKALEGRVTLINFFASWCTPCAAEMPELKALKQAHPRVHLIGVVWNDTHDTLKPWFKRHGNPFDSLWLDAKGNTVLDLGVRGIPETLVVDHRGQIRHRLSGPLTEDIRKNDFDARIRALLDEASHAPSP